MFYRLDSDPERQQGSDIAEKAAGANVGAKERVQIESDVLGSVRRYVRHICIHYLPFDRLSIEKCVILITEMGSFSIPGDSHDYGAIYRFQKNEDLQSLFQKAMRQDETITRWLLVSFSLLLGSHVVDLKIRTLGCLRSTCLDRRHLLKSYCDTCCSHLSTGKLSVVSSSQSDRRNTHGFSWGSLSGLVSGFYCPRRGSQLSLALTP